MSKIVRVLWTETDNASVTIKGASGVASPNFTVDGNAVTFPYTLNTSTSFVTTVPDTYTVSVTYFGAEIANTPDGVRVVDLTQDAELVFAPSPDQGGAVGTSMEVLNTAYVGSSLAPAVSTLKADPWAPWRAGLGNRHFSRAKVMWVGDSTGEGFGVSSFNNRTVTRLGKVLRALRPTDGIGSAGGIGYLPCFFQSSTLTAPYTVTGTAPLLDSSDFCMGIRAMRLNSATTVTYTVTGTAVDIWYLGGTTSGTFSISVDGGAATTQSTVQAANNTEAKFTLNLGASGSHTVAITATSTTNVWFGGMTVYDGDDAKGITILDASHGGYKSGDHFATTNRDGAYQQDLALAQPHLVILGLLINDERNAVPVATYQANLEAHVTKINANVTADPTILFLAPWREAASYTYPHDDYVTAMKAVVANHPNAVFLDMSQRLPKVDTDPSGIIYYDTIHPKEAGQAMLADTLAGILAAV